MAKIFKLDQFQDEGIAKDLDTPEVELELPDGSIIRFPSLKDVDSNAVLDLFEMITNFEKESPGYADPRPLLHLWIGQRATDALMKQANVGTIFNALFAIIQEVLELADLGERMQPGEFNSSAPASSNIAEKSDAISQNTTASTSMRSSQRAASARYLN